MNGSQATIVVSDLRGSTALAERLDPESLRQVMDRYFDEMRIVLEAHGGRVEKVIGDAIVAAFGLDGEGDDDGATGAVEAAAEAQSVLAVLNDHLDRQWGVRLATRTGICTGAVVVGMAAGDRVITGEAIDVATRLEQAAPINEILLADSTRRAVAGALVAPVGEVAVPGGSVLAHQLEEVRGSAAPVRATPTGSRPTSRRETRRTVTIVFADARIAPGGPPPTAEFVRDAMSHYFAVVREILERHGGTVERYIGDAVMSVFGLERRREDDALRGARAAVEMRDALADVNAWIAERGGALLEQRIGVNTGNLIAGDGADRQRLVTGDAVNVAARLEQVAAPGEVVVGEQTARLIEAAAVLEPLPPLTLKGKALPVAAFRVVEVTRTTARPRLDLPMVGRADELARLAGALAAAGRGSPRVAVVLGDAGVGKSRLVAELEAGADRLVVLRGQCPSYGEGLTFWPIAEMLHQVAGIGAEASADEARALLGALTPDEPDVAGRLAAICGLAETEFPIAELFWALRRLIRSLGRRGTVIVQIDDVHWAEPTLVDLIVHLAESDDAPLFVLLTARNELASRHPALITLPDCELVELRPLGAADAGSIVDCVLGEGGLPPGIRQRVVEAAAGNPLFVQQLLSMLVDTGRLELVRGRWQLAGDPDEIAIPPSIEMLVAARLDELPDDERCVIEPAAVIGRSFAASAVEVLVGEPFAPSVGLVLRELGDRLMVEPNPDHDVVDDHRFVHPMIRDVAYSGLLKRVRADVHERYGAWLERSLATQGRTAELDEILGHHLEQAHRCRADLGPLDDHGVDLGRRAAARLGAAGRRALERGDMPAAAGLLRRAARALPDDHADAAELMLSLGIAEMEAGRFDDADSTWRHAGERAALARARRLEVVAELERARLAFTIGVAGDVRAVTRQAEVAIESFAEPADDEVLAVAWRLLLNVHITECRYAAAEEAAMAVAAHARRAGNRLLVTRMGLVLAQLALRGPCPAGDGVLRCERYVDELSGDRQAAAVARRALAALRAMRGDLDGARGEFDRCRAELEEFGWFLDAALVSLDSGPIALLAGDPQGAEQELRRDLATLQAMGDQNYIATTAGLLAEALYRQGRLGEAEEVVGFSRSVAVEGDVATHIIWRSVHAKIVSRRGETEAGVAVGREAVDLADLTDDLTVRGEAYVDFAETLRLAGRDSESLQALRTARRSHLTKGNQLALARVDTLIGEMRR